MANKFIMEKDGLDMYMNQPVLERVVKAFNELNIDMFDYNYSDYGQEHLVDLHDHGYFQVRFSKNEGIMGHLGLGRRGISFGDTAIGITAGEFQDLIDLFPIRLQRLIEDQIRREEE